MPTNTWKYGGSVLGTEFARGAQTEIAAILLYGIPPPPPIVLLEQKSQCHSALVCSIEDVMSTKFVQMI